MPSERHVSLQDVLTAFAKGIEEFRDATRPIFDRLAETSHTFQAYLSSPEFHGLVADMQQGLRDYVARFRGIFEDLGENGWYPDDVGMTSTEMRRLVHQFRNGDAAAADEWLCRYFDAAADDIVTRIAKSFPGRERLLRSAIQAHKEGRYELSIPVLLAQAEGMCVETENLKKSPYSRTEKGKGPPVTAALPIVKASMGDDDVEGLTLHLLTVGLPISANRDERRRFGKILNRHAVLHGENVDYGCHKHGCQALAFVCFTEQVVRCVRERAKAA